MWPSKTVIPPSIEHLLFASTLHQGTIARTDSKMRDGRVQVELTGALGEGKENWTPWIEFIGNTASSGNAKTASGIWWPPNEGDIVYVGFKDGDYLQPYAVPGPIWSQKPEPNQSNLQSEVKTVGKKENGAREATKVRSIRDESGNTLFFSSIGGKECAYLVDTWGQGVYMVAPGKQTDPKEKEGEKNKHREAFTREDKSVATQTAPKPGEVLKSKEAVMGLLGLNGGGLMVYSGDGKGSITLQASNANGETNGPSIFLDSKNSAIILTAGDTQLVINGQKGQVEVTKQVVQEKPKIDVETTIKNHKNFLKSNLSYFTSAGSSSSSSSGQSSGQSSSGSSSSGSLPPGSTSNFGNMAGFTG